MWLKFFMALTIDFALWNFGRNLSLFDWGRGRMLVTSQGLPGMIKNRLSRIPTNIDASMLDAGSSQEVLISPQRLKVIWWSIVPTQASLK